MVCASESREDRRGSESGDHQGIETATRDRSWKWTGKEGGRRRVVEVHLCREEILSALLRIRLWIERDTRSSGRHRRAKGNARNKGESRETRRERRESLESTYIHTTTSSSA